MIRISLGNVGSGKTACEVREMALNRLNRKIYSNIITKIPHCMALSSDMIVQKNIVSVKKTRQGEERPVYDLTLNVDYWKNIKEPINVVLDEAHSIMNSRRSMSKANILISDWLALIRRVLGATSEGYGELVLVTQLRNRIDIIARDMAHQIRYHVCHFNKRCRRCGISWSESSEQPEGQWSCLSCGSTELVKEGHVIEVWHFQGFDMYDAWKEFGQKSFYKHYYITDIEKYFHLYNTLQWDNLFSDIYI